MRLHLKTLKFFAQILFHPLHRPLGYQCTSTRLEEHLMMFKNINYAQKKIAQIVAHWLGISQSHYLWGKWKTLIKLSCLPREMKQIITIEFNRFGDFVTLSLAPIHSCTLSLSLSHLSLSLSLTRSLSFTLLLSHFLSLSPLSSLFSL